MRFLELQVQSHIEHISNVQSSFCILKVGCSPTLPLHSIKLEPNLIYYRGLLSSTIKRVYGMFRITEFTIPDYFSTGINRLCQLTVLTDRHTL